MVDTNLTTYLILLIFVVSGDWLGPIYFHVKPRIPSLPTPFLCPPLNKSDSFLRLTISATRSYMHGMSSYVSALPNNAHIWRY